MKAGNRQYKDSLFRDIFNNKERLPELYEALAGIRTTPEEIKLANLDETLFSGIKNDVGFFVGDRHILLTEHQSTLNANMPLRLAMYLMEIYRQYLPPDAIYKRGMIRLPAPKLYVLYNGEAEKEDRWTQRLSDAFGGQSDVMELIVDVININHKQGRQILEKCPALKAYSVFIAKVREQVQNGSPLELAVADAVIYCIKHDLLAEYFRQKYKEEVFHMLDIAWNQERALEVRAAEAREEGRLEGRLEAREEERVFSIQSIMANFNVSMEKAMDALQIPVAERAKYAAMVKG